MDLTMRLNFFKPPMSFLVYMIQAQKVATPVSIILQFELTDKNALFSLCDL